MLAVLAEEHAPPPPCAAPSAPSTPRSARDGGVRGRARVRLEASGGGRGGGGGGAAGDTVAARRRSRARRGPREERARAGARPWETQLVAPRRPGVLHVPLHAADFAAPPRSSEPPLRGGAAAVAHHTAAAVLPAVSAQCLAERLDPDSAAQQAQLQLL